MSKQLRLSLGQSHRGHRFEKLEPRHLLSAASLIPLAGDWDGDGVDTTGYYDQQTGTVSVSNDDVSGFADLSFRFGPENSNYLAVAGDFNDDGRDTVALFDPGPATFYIKNSLAPGAADAVFGFGPDGQGWLPVAGDWDGDGFDTIGLYNQQGGKAYLKNSLSAGAADLAYRYGPKNENWIPITGDWNNNTIDSLSLYDADAAKVYQKNTNTVGAADVVFEYGPGGSSWTPLVGDWDGNSTDTIGLYDHTSEKTFLRNTNDAGPADLEFFVVPGTNPTITQIALPAIPATLSAAEVEQLLSRAAAASSSEDAIIAIVDRSGNILGVRAEADVLANFDPDGDPTTDPGGLVFAIDGAVAKARTAAFFANADPRLDTGTPLTSRTIRFISQSTITQREVEGDPSSTDDEIRGPGFVAPIGTGGHFPPEILHTPPVDLFAIENTNRDGTVHPGADRIRDPITLDAFGNVTSVSGDDILLPNRFNVEDAYIGPDGLLPPPDSYGFASGLVPNAQSRGIATLPGGIPLFRNGTLVGGIGVFIPGPDGYATHEQGYVADIGQTEFERTNAPLVLETEWIAFAAAGGSSGVDASVGTLDGVAPVTGFDLPFGRLTLVGVELEVYGPLPDGVQTLLDVGVDVGVGDSTNGANQQLIDTVNGGLTTLLDGEDVAEGWLVLPHGSAVDDISSQDVIDIVANGVTEANEVRAAVRLPMSNRTKMVLSVADTEGNVLGLFRMQDATVFSIDVAVAKARNTAYYADAAAIQDIDLVDASVPQNGVPDLDPGTAFTNRTFRFLAEARFPDGVDDTPPGPFSILNDPGVDIATAESLPGPPTSYTDFTSVLGFDSFNPGSNFRDPDNIANQNGIVFFPGSTPIYDGATLLGGFGVSGDGVDQDDVVTAFGALGFMPSDAVLRADDVFVRDVRLPYFKFLRNPEG